MKKVSFKITCQIKLSPFLFMFCCFVFSNEDQLLLPIVCQSKLKIVSFVGFFSGSITTNHQNTSLNYYVCNIFYDSSQVVNFLSIFHQIRMIFFSSKSSRRSNKILLCYFQKDFESLLISDR